MPLEVVQTLNWLEPARDKAQFSGWWGTFLSLLDAVRSRQILSGLAQLRDVLWAFGSFSLPIFAYFRLGGYDLAQFWLEGVVEWKWTCDLDKWLPAEPLARALLKPQVLIQGLAEVGAKVTSTHMCVDHDYPTWIPHHWLVHTPQGQSANKKYRVKNPSKMLDLILNWTLARLDFNLASLPRIYLTWDRPHIAVCHRVVQR